MNRKTFQEIYHRQSYHHPIYTPGHWVFIKESIREIHSMSPAAGKTLKTCYGTYGKSDDPDLQQIIDAEEKERAHDTLVPVQIDREIWLIEEEYVELVD